MIVIPAIDLKNGECVRLRQGRFDDVTVFERDPAAQALKWQNAGAARIHVVDLDGSTAGSPRNREAIKSILDAVRVPIQLGGGIRDRATVETYLSMGVNMVVLGTLAASDRKLTSKLLASYPERIIIGVDAQDGMVAVNGWTHVTEIRATDLAKYYADLRPAYFVYTDIRRDGMMQGPNFHSTREFALSTPIPVILSGGVSTMADVEAVGQLEGCGVSGMIIGRALYDGKINLKEAIKLAERKRNVSEENHSLFRC